MGKKSYPRWLLRLLRINKPSQSQSQSHPSFSDDSNNHAIAVAAATAAAAEVAITAAKAAAAVVRLTSRRGGGDVSQRRWSVEEYLGAVRIQSAFRGYLARRALRALKGLVKLQALVRGHFVRKRSADMLRRMHTMLRVQARARANRVHYVETANHGLERNRKLDHQRRPCCLKLNEASLLKRSGSVSTTRDTNIHTARANRTSASWVDPRAEDCLRTCSHNSLSRTLHMDDERAEKVLEIDSWRPRLAPIISRNYPGCNAPSKDYYAYETPHHHHHHHSFAGLPDTYPRYSMNHNLQSRSPCNSESVLTLQQSLNLPPVEHDFSPQACSVPSRPGSGHSKNRTMSPFTPTRNECTESLYGEGEHMGGLYCPSYMAFTESSRAKVRSQSVPRQRVDWFESHGSSRRLYTYGNAFELGK